MKIVLEKYNNRLQTYKDIVDKASPKRSSEEYAYKVVEDTITKSRGRLKTNYRRRDRSTSQKTEISQKGITNIILKKGNTKSRMDK